LTDLRLRSLVKMSRDIRPNQERCFHPKETYCEHTSELCVLRVKHGSETLSKKCV
jgi:hypothetical protein